ncbi:MAG: hypothetical protein FRX49_12246 [Trebouxia sp. A1-2]|nr:MAG: hypothetical protein FRX49_12246 [Trebouxia sp. A1-2]
MALTIVQIKLSAEAICGVTLEPYLQVRKGTSTTVSGEDVPEEGVSDSRYVLRYRWYRSVHRGGQICWIHPDREATVQCILCLRSRAEIRKSFHCTPECLQQHWPQHRQLHEQRRLKGPENGYVTELSRSSQTVTAGGETWIEVGKSRSYTPSPEDVGSSIKCEVVPVDSSSHFNETGAASSASTGRVRPVPLCPQRALVPVPPPRGGNPAGKFTALTYNLLADLYASEVQSNHFDNFLAPELQKAGYTAIYKRKTTELYTGSSYAIDGCATFFKRDKFALVKKYEVEFNKAALSLSDSIPADQKKAALNRLLKDNVALIAVLEALDPPQLEGANRRQLICIANTHIHANPELNDVKLWQVHTLLKGLEKIAASADIPMLVAGDFNSVPGSAAHSLLVNRIVENNHPELQNDPLGILRPASKLQHNLHLASAYAAVHEARDGGPALQKQKRRMDPKYHEPKFTNMGQGFQGTLDYVLYTTNSLVPTATLELPDESDIKDTRNSKAGLPNETWSSDHIALLAEFQYKQT